MADAARWLRSTMRLGGAVVVAGVALAAVALAGVVGAQDKSIGEAREEREATLAEKARAAEQLKVLSVAEGELRAALASIDEALALQEARVAAALAAVARAEEEADAARRAVVATSEQVAALRARTSQSAVNAYIGASGRGDQGIFTASDVMEIAQRQRLLDMVQGDLADDLDQLRALIEDQRRAEADAARAVERAEQLRKDMAAAQAELEQRRAVQARLEAELRARIGDVEAKIGQLDAAERELDEIIRKRLEEEAAAAAAANGTRTIRLSSSSASGFAYPASGPITSPFGWRRHPVLGTARLHAGLDIGAAYGSDVWASKAGEVIFSGWNGGYGNCVMIAHAGGVVTLYGHMSELYVSEGQQVAQGTVIGAIGSTGLSTGPHLHFETRVGDEPQDPLGFLD